MGTTDAGAFWRVVAEHGVKALFSAPTAMRAIKKEDPDATHLNRYDLSALQYLFQAGERLDPATYHWASEKLGIPVVDHWWQTETGWSIAAAPMGIEAMTIKPGSATVPMPGYDVHVLRPDGTECEAGEEGSICVKLPLPPGTLPTLWGDDDRYVASNLSAFPGYYLSGDGGYLDEDGYLFVMGRTDDTINVAGHRLSTGAIEAVLATHPAVAECAVIRCRRPHQGAGAAGGRRPQVRRVGRRFGRRADRRGSGEHRRGRESQARRRRLRTAEDPVGQDPAQDHARHRRRSRRARAVDHRGRRRPRRADTDPQVLTHDRAIRHIVEWSYVDIRPNQQRWIAMRVPDQKAGGCTCHCNACDGGHHCGNPPNCNVRR